MPNIPNEPTEAAARRYCRDCRFCRVKDTGLSLARCDSPNAAPLNVGQQYLAPISMWPPSPAPCASSPTIAALKARGLRPRRLNRWPHDPLPRPSQHPHGGRSARRYRSFPPVLCGGLPTCAGCCCGPCEACGRGLPTRADKAAGDAVMINLLHHVEGDQGGFLGLSDAALEAYCARKGYDLAAVISAMYAPTPWPVPQAVAA
jgi:hypothetical protein